MKPYNVRLTEDQIRFLQRVGNASDLLRRLIDRERLRSAVEDSSNKRILTNSKIEELDDKINFLKKKLEEVKNQLENQVYLREFYEECLEFIKKAKEKGADHASHLSFKHARIDAKKGYSTTYDKEGPLWEVNIIRSFSDQKGVEYEEEIKFKGSEESCLDRIEKWVNENLPPITQEELRFKKACEALEEEIKSLEDKKASMVKEFIEM